MRAVNLIPSESLRGGGSGGTGALALLGGLAVLLALVTFYVTTGNTVVERRAELDTLRGQVATAQAQAEATRPYRQFAALAQARVETVRQLGSARFDWHDAFADLSKVLPDDVWLTALTGTVTTGVSVGGGSSGASGLRGAIPNPAIEMTGCTVDHESVVRLISHLRLMNNVERVSLADSSKDAGGECQQGNTSFPQFNLVVFFEPIPTVAAPVTPAAPSATPIATTDPSASTTPPTSGAPTDGTETPRGAGDG
jgi:Tfp pilus assembly protein PilN